MLIQRVLSVCVLVAVLASCASFGDFADVLIAMDSDGRPAEAAASGSGSAPRFPDASRSARFVTDWEWVSPATGSHNLNAVIDTENGFLAAGAGGSVLYSDNGDSWELRQFALGDISHAAYGDGMYVVAGDLPDASLHFSADGRQWFISEFEEPLDDGYRLIPRGLVWTGEHFLLNTTVTDTGFGGANRFYRSEDGYRWSVFESDNSSAGQMSNVNGTLYSSIGGSSVVRYSRNGGRSWEELAPVDDLLFSGITSITYNSGSDRYLALRPQHRMGQSIIYESTDGLEWEVLTQAEGPWFITAVPLEAGFLLSQINPEEASFYTLSGNELSPMAGAPKRSDGVPLELSAFAHSGDRVIGVGTNGSLVSFDASGSPITVLGDNSFGANTINSVARGDDGLLVAVGEQLSIFTSSDGTSWERIETDFERVQPGDTLNQVVWTGDVFAVSGSPVGKMEPEPLILISSDGRSWVESEANRQFGVSVRRLASDGDGQYLGLDGVEIWTGQSVHSRYTTVMTFSGSDTSRFGSARIDDRVFRDAVYDGSRYLLAGNAGYIAFSDDNGGWTVQEGGPDADVSLLAWFNGRYIAGGSTFVDDPELWTSTDGTQWSRIDLDSWAGVNSFREVNGTLYGIAHGRLWQTGDGVEWTSERIPDGVTDIFAAADGTLYALGQNGMLLARR